MNELLTKTDRKKSSPIAWIIKGSFALAVTVLALWWSARDVPLDIVQERLSTTDWMVVAMYIGAQFVIHGVRTIRWGLLVRPLGQPSRRAVFSAASVGIPAAMFLPLRLGEFVRPVMIRRAGVPFASGLASVVVERAADGLTNVGLFFALLSLLPETAVVAPEIRIGAKIALGVFGGACIVLVLVGLARQRALSIISQILDPFSKPFSKKITDLLATFLTGLRPLVQPGRGLAFIALTITYWALNGYVTWELICSYGIDVPLLAGPFTVSVLVFAVMVPAGPAFIGPMQAGFKAGLAAYAVSATDSLVVGITAHLATVFSFSIILALGFLAAEPKTPSDKG